MGVKICEQHLGKQTSLSPMFKTAGSQAVGHEWEKGKGFVEYLPVGTFASCFIPFLFYIAEYWWT